MLSWTKGLDSCGCTATPDSFIGPFVDPGQDLVHLDLAFDNAAGNFKLHATRIVTNFKNLVDADIDSNKIYIIENGNTSGLYEFTLPVKQATFVEPITDDKELILYPNPARDEITMLVNESGTVSIKLLDINGQQLLTREWKNFDKVERHITFGCSDLASGCYTLEITKGNSITFKKVNIMH